MQTLRFKQALALIEKKKIIPTKEARTLGIHPEVWMQLKAEGKIIPLHRGIYCAKDALFTYPEFVLASLVSSQMVVCLVSALHFHGLTTQIPSQTYLALPKGHRIPSLFFPVRFFLWTGAVYEEGVETHLLDGVSVKIYNPEKTVVDCFRMRNKIGLDVAVEALKMWFSKRRKHMLTLQKYMKSSRMEKVMNPYLEALI